VFPSLSSAQTLPDNTPIPFPGCPSLYLAALCRQKWEQRGLCLPSFKGSEQGSKKCRWPNSRGSGHLLLPTNFTNTRTPTRPVWPPRSASFGTLRSPTEAEPFRSAAQSYFHVCSAVKPWQYILKSQLLPNKKKKERKKSISRPFLPSYKSVMWTNNIVLFCFYDTRFSTLYT